MTRWTYSTHLENFLGKPENINLCMKSLCEIMVEVSYLDYISLLSFEIVSYSGFISPSLYCEYFSKLLNNDFGVGKYPQTFLSLILFMYSLYVNHNYTNERYSELDHRVLCL